MTALLGPETLPDVSTAPRATTSVGPPAMCDMIPNAEHWRVSVWEAQELQHAIMGYLPGYATPRIVCDVPYVGKRWVHQLAEYDRELGISYWTKNYRTGIELEDPEALDRRYPYYDPISALGEADQKWWSDQT